MYTFSKGICVMRKAKSLIQRSLHTPPKKKKSRYVGKTQKYPQNRKTTSYVLQFKINYSNTEHNRREFNCDMFQLISTENMA